MEAPLQLKEHQGGDNLAILDGEEHRVGEAAFGLLKMLQANKGDMVLATVIKGHTGTRCERSFATLPAALQRIIDKPEKAGKGYRML